MPDRSLRLYPLPPGASVSWSPREEGHGAPLAREYRPAPPQGRQHEEHGAAGAGTEGSGGPQGAGGSGGPGGSDGPGGSQGAGDGGQHGPQDDNPFAPPPEGAPDRPWQPRHPSNGPGGDGRSGPGAGSGGDGRNSPWGSQWSDQQPGRTPGGGFGDRPGRQNPPDGPSGQGGGGMRWDPTDPAQRRARYALLGGMWAFFFALFGWRELALLLGALALYWSISSLRAKPRKPDPRAVPAGAAGSPSAGGYGGAPGPGAGGGTGATGAPGARPQKTAAVSGLVTAVLALSMVALTFTAQLVYSDYYTCVDDALTSSAKQSCDHLLPKDLRTILGEDS